MFTKRFKLVFSFFILLIMFLSLNVRQSAAALPDQPVVIAPSDGATDISISPTLEVNVSDPDGENLTVNFYGRPVGPTAGEDFTIIAMPDTQHYTDNPAYAANFSAQTQWIVDNLESRNIVFVTGLGDIVQNGNTNDSEWQIANAAYSLIEDPLTTFLTDGIPYGLSVGNHDQTPIGGGSSASTSKFNQYFGESRFLGRGYYGGHHGADNDNSYQLFSGGGMDFIAIHFEYDTSPEQDVLDWADALLTTYSDRRAILSTHYMIGLGNPASWGSQGLAIYNALSDHENLFLMLGGHIHGEGRRQDTAVNGNVVNTLLSDYQDYTNGGNGFLRIMTFSPANDTIFVQTYSPVLDQYETDDSSEFTLSYDMDGTAPFQLIGSNSNVPSGSSTSTTWPGLDGTTEYEWYVTVDDGSGSLTTSATWNFTTLEPDPADIPPDTIITDAPANPSSSDNATFIFSGTDNLTDPGSLTFACQLDGGGYASCTSPFSYSSLANGAHTFEVRATDTDGNTDPTPASYTWTVDTTTPVVVQSRVSQSSDDAEERDSDGVLDLTSTDLEMAHDSQDSSSVDQFVGLRFQNVTIPADATIINAYIEFETDETSSGTTSLTIYGQADDNPATFTTGDYDISVRPQTTASAAWNPGAWNTTSEKHQTSDLSAVVQELVNRAGWASGNALVFIIEGSGQRIAESWDGESENAPLLVVEYSQPTTDPTIIVTGTPLTPFNTVPGVLSAEQSYTVMGNNLTDDILITPPGDFEISLSSGTGFGSSLLLPETGGVVAATAVYVRFNRATTGTSSGDIIHTSAGATTQNVAVSGDAAPLPSLPIAVGDNWRYFKGTAEPASNWNSVAFNDASWLLGSSGFGYDDDDDATVLTDMENGYLTVYARKAFHVDDPNEIANLILAMDYDDGFVVYLNGTEVARDNVTGTPPAYDTVADANHEASNGDNSPSPIETYNVDPGLLLVGTNVLAVQGHNRSMDSSDFSLIPSLEVDDGTVPTTVTIRVNQDSDDAEENVADGSVDLTSSDLELIHDSQGGNFDQVVGMRFASVAIPANATIVSAYIEFETDETSTETTSLTIYGQADDNPGTFTTGDNDISARTQTAASAAWSPGAWNTVSEKHQTSDLSAIVQELVNRTGWLSGNAMVFIIEGSGQRIAESYDGESANAPLLVIEYSEPAAGVLGDVNDDSSVNSTDALIILSCDAGFESPFCPTIAACGDVNADALVDSTDALIVLSFDAGLVVPYPVGQAACSG